MPQSRFHFKLFAPRGDRTPSMPFILLPSLIDMTSIAMVMPVLPALVGTFTDSPMGQAFWYGVVVFTFGIVNFFGSPVLGALSDAHGRRPVLLIGFFGLGLNYFATAVATSLLMLIAVRLVGAAMQGNIAVANAYAADITPAAQRARRFGMLGAMLGAGLVIGPVIGGLLATIDLRIPFYVAGALSLLNLLYGYFVLPESLPAGKRRPYQWKAANPFNSLRGVTQLKGAGRLVAVLAYSSLAQFMFNMCWVLYTTFKFGWGPWENGWSLAAAGVVSAVAQGLLVERILKRVSPRKLAVFGLVSSMLAYALWGAATQGWMIFAIIAVNVLGPTVSATIRSMISGAADAKHQGKTLGAIGSLESLMTMVAPILGTAMLAMVSELSEGDWRIGAPLFFCAALQAAALMLAISQFRGESRARGAAAKH